MTDNIPNVTSELRLPSPSAQISSTLISERGIEGPALADAHLEYSEYMERAKAASAADRYGEAGRLYSMAARTAKDAGMVKKDIHDKRERLESTEKGEALFRRQLEYAAGLPEKMRQNPPPWARNNPEQIPEVQYMAYFAGVDIVLRERLPIQGLAELVDAITSKFPERSEAEVVTEIVNKIKAENRYTYLEGLARHYDIGEGLEHAASRRLMPTRTISWPDKVSAELAVTAFDKAGMLEEAVRTVAEFDLTVPGAYGGTSSRACLIINKVEDIEKKKVLIGLAQDGYRAIGNDKRAEGMQEMYTRILLPANGIEYLAKAARRPDAKDAAAASARIRVRV